MNEMLQALSPWPAYPVAVVIGGRIEGHEEVWAYGAVEVEPGKFLATVAPVEADRPGRSVCLREPVWSDAKVAVLAARKVAIRLAMA